MPVFSATAPGKMILVGEHAVVYGQPAIAFPVPEIQAKAIIEPNINGETGEIEIDSSDISLNSSLDSLNPENPFVQIVKRFQDHFHIHRIPACTIRISSTIPVASGMGSGAAVSAVIFRALAAFTGKIISDQEVNELTFEIEKIFHGNPSGIDNTVISFQKPVYFIKNKPPEILNLSRRFTFVMADTGIRSSTLQAVEAVNRRWEKSKGLFDEYFKEIGDIVRKMKQELEQGNDSSIGSLMTRNHELLQKIGVSNPALNSLVDAAMKAGALGAKLIGAGLGGSIAALAVPQNAVFLAESLKKAGATWTLTSTFKPRES